MDDGEASGNLGGATRGASMIVIRGDAVLMVERSQAPSRGLWSFPAGRREPGETAEANARRELLEETGLAVGELVQLGEFRPAGAPPQFRLTVFAARAGAGNPHAGDDAAKAEFVRFPEVLDRQMTAGAVGWIARAIAALAAPGLP